MRGPAGTRTGEAPLVIDGSHGEGGGQILRATLALAAVLERPVVVHAIRAGRPNPGLAAQHLVAVRAVATLCDALLEGDALGSTTLSFRPRRARRAGVYEFDVAAAREGGSAGAVTLVLQALLPPLALADGRSRIAVHGGTHVPWSPPFDYLAEVWLPTLERVGLAASATLERWGFYPAGGGLMRVEIAGASARQRPLHPLALEVPGALLEVGGRAVAAELPAHIAQRMADRARALLGRAGIAAAIEPRRVRAASPGAGLFLTARYENVLAGFGALGRPGLPAEEVAADATAALLAHRDSGAAVERHLADQLVVPLALAAGRSSFTAECATGHLETTAWVVERFGLARVTIQRRADGTAQVTIEGDGVAGR